MFHVAVVLVLIGYVSASEYYVQAPDGTSCPVNTKCQELSFYTNRSDQYFVDNTIFYFLEGTHIMEDSVVINNVSNLTLHGLGQETVMVSTVVIQCKGANVGFAFLYSSFINIIDETFIGCGLPLLETKLINQYLSNVASNTSIVVKKTALSFYESQNITITDSSVQNSLGVGLLLVNAFDTQIKRSYFSNNTDEGNAFIFYDNPVICGKDGQLKEYSLDITDSYFMFGLGFRWASGLSIICKQNCDYQLNVKLVSIYANHNIGTNWGNVCFSATKTVKYYSLSIKSLITRYGGNLSVTAGAGMVLSIGFPDATPTCMCNYSIPEKLKQPIQVVHSQFNGNTAIFGSGLLISARPVDGVPISQEILIDSCQFNNNIGFAGSGLYITNVVLLPFHNPLVFILSNLTVTGNILLNNGTSCAMFLYGVQLATITAITISDNNSTGLLIYNSIASFYGYENLISNNSASQGGGVAIYGDSYIIINNNTYLSLHGNKAMQYGAGIYINTESPFLHVCQIQVQNLTNKYIPNSQINFVNNTADIAGSAIYGGVITECQNILGGNTPQTISPETIFHVLNISEQKDLSVVSSDAEKVCLCSGESYNCNVDQTKNITAFPGDIMKISLVAVGQINGITNGFIVIEDTGNTQSSGQVLPIPSHCSIVNHTIRQTNTNVTTSVLSIETAHANGAIENSFGNNSITIFVTILPCPHGFSLSSMDVCNCSPELTQNIQNISCNITNQEIQRQGNVWIGYSNSSDCVIIDNNCPFDYCISSLVTFTLSETDPQCAMNRSGLLCGQCAEGLSLMFGSNKCGECDNSYISLFIPFALAGIGLVVFLVALNLTVSVGTINGLIFYANIIKINENVFFPNGPIPFLSQFISWLNLDLGFETCFYKGMDSYAKTWLQFVFPFYIWIIIGFIILIFHLFGKLSKYTPQNLVQVLATLILLSYTKLFSIIILGFRLVIFNCDTDDYNVRWKVDPNIEYFSPKHVILFIFSLLVLLFLSFPYTITLFLNPFIGGHISHFRICRCCVSMKPLFDAYYGPYKDKFRFWTGFLLLARLVLILVISFTTREVAFATIISITAILIGITASAGGIYTKLHLNILESFFYVLLVIHSSFSNIGESNITTILATLSAFIVFIAILVYHTYILLKDGGCSKATKLVLKTFKHNSSDLLLPDKENPSVNDQSVTKTVVDTSVHLRRRETLLEDFSNSFVHYN